MNKQKETEKKWNDFKIVVLGIIFDTQKRKILLGKKKKDIYIPELTWCFPGGKLIYHEEMDKTLKRKIKEQTGLIVKNLGSIFADKNQARGEIVEIYFLCEAVGGKEKPGDDLVEIKWANPEEVHEYFTSPFNTRFKEYIINLK